MAKFLRLRKRPAWATALCASPTQVFTEEICKKGVITSADFHWELVADCLFGLTKISICRCTHAPCETLDSCSVAMPVLAVMGQICTQGPRQGFPALVGCTGLVAST